MKPGMNPCIGHLMNAYRDRKDGKHIDQQILRFRRYNYLQDLSDSKHFQDRDNTTLMIYYRQDSDAAIQSYGIFRDALRKGYRIRSYPSFPGHPADACQRKLGAEHDSAAGTVCSHRHRRRNGNLRLPSKHVNLIHYFHHIMNDSEYLSDGIVIIALNDILPESVCYR